MHTLLFLHNKLHHRSSQVLYSLSRDNSYCKISWSHEAGRFRLSIFQLLWNLTGASWILSNFKSILQFLSKLTALRHHKILLQDVIMLSELRPWVGSSHLTLPATMALDSKLVHSWENLIPHPTPIQPHIINMHLKSRHGCYVNLTQ